MNEHERFTKQLEESFAVLRTIADELEKYGVPPHLDPAQDSKSGWFATPFL